VDVPRERSIATRSGLLALAVLAAAAGSLAEPNDALPAVGAPSLTVPFFVDRKLGDGMRTSLEEAVRRLSDSRCQDVLGDFTDGRGRTLEANLRETGQTLPAYLGYVRFYDGSTTEPCESERVLAWTSPGSRAVHVCWSQFSYWQRANPGYTATIVIHETLHTPVSASPPTRARSPRR
jgi:hypothetical protein